MKQKKGFIRRYMPAFLASAVFIAFILAYPHAREKANCSLLGQLSTMVMVIPPIFFLMGLLDVWVPRETLISLMGSKSVFAERSSRLPLAPWPWVRFMARSRLPPCS